MDLRASLKSRSKRTLEPVFKVKVTPPQDHMREEITEQSRILREKGVQVEGALSSGEEFKGKFTRLDLGPLFDSETMGRVGPTVPNMLEDHTTSIPAPSLEVRRCAV